MATRVVEWKKPYTWGKAISIDENKVISLNLRDENNLIIYDEWDDEIYVDLQLDDEITPTSAFPIWVNVGRVIVDNWWDKPWTIISAETTSGDNIKIFYADEWTLWIDNWTGTFKQIYFKADVDALLLALRNYIDWELAKKQNWVSSDTAPENPSEWDLWYDTTNSAMKVWDWTAWQSVGTWWGGSDIEYVTQAEYNALLPWALTDNKHYFIYTGSWGGWWWQPWVNTVAYYPLEENTNDQTGTYDLTPTDITYTTLASWLKVATFNWSSSKAETSSFTTATWDYTVSLWVSTDNIQSQLAVMRGNATSDNSGRIFDWYNNNFRVLLQPWGYLATNNAPVQDGNWYYITVTSIWNTVSFYLDTTLIDTRSGSCTVHSEMFIGYRQYNNDRFWKGYISRLIIENKGWDATEISDYYNLTKWDYWIS